MKLFYEEAKGEYVELKEVGCIGEGDIVIRLDACMSKEHLDKKERELSEKFGRKVIVLDGMYKEIMVVPPKK